MITTGDAVKASRRRGGRRARVGGALAVLALVVAAYPVSRSLLRPAFDAELGSSVRGPTPVGSALSVEDQTT